MHTEIATTTGPAVPAIWETLDQFHFFYEGSTVIINRLPLPDERVQFVKRITYLERILAPIKKSSVEMKEAKRLLAQFFLGYPSLLNAPAQEMITAYISDLQDISLLTLRESLDDIKHGRVMVSDGKGRQMSIEKDWPPSSTRIHDVAVKRSEAQWNELVRLRTIIGPVQLARPEISPEERARFAVQIKKMHGEFTKRIEQDSVEISAREEHELRQKAAAELSHKALLRDYTLQGLEPVYADKEKTIIVSLAMMLATGHKIERDASGGARLTGPTRA